MGWKGQAIPTRSRDCEKAYRRGYHVVRMNQRNCGGRKGLRQRCTTGMSGDYRAVLEELIEKRPLRARFFLRVFEGGNLVTKNGGGGLRMMLPTALKRLARFVRRSIWGLPDAL